MYDIIVAGDLLADETQHVTVTGPSPENANVLSVTEGKLECSPGGAGNVALNCAGLGRSTMLLATIGRDDASHVTRDALYRGKVHPDLVFQLGHRIRARRRIVSPDGMLLRLNRNTTVSESNLVTAAHYLENELQVLVLSDYGGGYLTNEDALHKVLNRACEVKCPILVDPPRDGNWKRFGSGHTIFKPNIRQAVTFLRRAAAAFNEPPFVPFWYVDDSSIVLNRTQACELACNLAAAMRSEGIVSNGVWITLGPGGSVVYNSSREVVVDHYPVSSQVEVRDVTGAGDTAMAVMAAALSKGEPFANGVKLANIAGGIAVQKRGCWKANWDEIIAVLNRLHPDSVSGDLDVDSLFRTAMRCAGLEK